MSTIPQYGFKADDLVKEGRTTRSNIEDVKKWLTYKPNIPEMPEEQIVLFLMACQNSVEDTQLTISNYFRLKHASPELFSKTDIDSKENQYTHTVSKFAVFPKRTKENYVIAYGGLRDTTYYNFSLEPQIKMLFYTIDMFLQNNPPAGLVFIMDIKGVGIMHLTRLKIGPLRKFFAYLQEALPTRLITVHILNASYIFEKILAITKPFMKKELFDLIISHPPGSNMQEFFEKYIPASCMPCDFGGELPPLDRMCDDLQTNLRKAKSYLNAGEKQVQLYKPEK